MKKIWNNLSEKYKNIQNKSEKPSLTQGKFVGKKVFR